MIAQQLLLLVMFSVNYPLPLQPVKASKIKLIKHPGQSPRLCTPASGIDLERNSERQKKSREMQR